MIKRLRGLGRLLVDAARRLDQDNGLFMASGLAFNMLLCVLPFLLIVVSLSGYVLESSVAAQQKLMSLAGKAFPEATHELQGRLSNLLHDREIIGVLGLLALALTASRLFGGIRVVLKIAYGHELDLNLITGKLFDMGMVVLTSVLLLCSIAISWLVTILEEFSRAWFAERGLDIGGLNDMAAHGFAYVFSAAMFFVMYRTPLPRRIPTKVLLLTSLFVGLLWEMAKWLFEFYLSKFATYDVLYGSFGVLVILVLWINYTAVIFVIGAELGAALLSQRRSRNDLPAPTASPRNGARAKD